MCRRPVLRMAERGPRTAPAWVSRPGVRAAGRAPAARRMAAKLAAQRDSVLSRAGEMIGSSDLAARPRPAAQRDSVSSWVGETIGCLDGVAGLGPAADRVGPPDHDRWRREVALPGGKGEPLPTDWTPCRSSARTAPLPTPAPAALPTQRLPPTGRRSLQYRIPA